MLMGKDKRNVHETFEKNEKLLEIEYSKRERRKKNCPCLNKVDRLYSMRKSE